MYCVLMDDYAKDGGMAERNLLPRCIVCFDRIPMESFKIGNSNAMDFGKNLLAAIFSIIVPATCTIPDQIKRQNRVSC